MNHYGVLGIKRTASQEEVRHAYRQLAMKLHPDQTGRSDSDRFREIQQAYEVLGDPDSRQAYDRTHSEDVPVHIISQDGPGRVTEVRSSYGPSQLREIYRRSVAEPYWENWFRDLWKDLFRRF